MTNTPPLTTAEIYGLAESLSTAMLTHRTDSPLARRLLTIASRLAQTSAGQYTRDDLAGEMVTALLTNAQRFDGNATAYIVRHCVWVAKHCTQRGRTYHRRCPEMPTRMDDDGCETDLAEVMPDPTAPSPEALLIEAETHTERENILQAVRSQLKGAGARVFDGLRANLTNSELATRCKVSRPAISNGMKAIRRAAASLC